MRSLVTAAATFALLAAIPSALRTASAHGGCYAHAPGDPRDVANGGSLPDGAPSGPATSGGAAPGARKIASPTNWTFWWDRNKGEFLEQRGATRRIWTGSTSASAFGRPTVLARGLAVTDWTIELRIAPVLRALLADDTRSVHIRSAAAVALAKIGDTASVLLFEQLALNEDGTVHREIEESAALSLGLLGWDTPQIRGFLIDLMNRGRREGFTQPFAAAALGLLADPACPDAETTAALFDRIARGDENEGVRPACLLAIGHSGDEESIPALVAMIRRGRATERGEPLSELDMSYAVTALGKIGMPGTTAHGEETLALGLLLRLVDERSDASLSVRRSAALALGQVGPQCVPRLQRHVATTLERLAEDASDEQVRHFATIALGRLGAAPQVEGNVRARIEATLTRVVESNAEGTSTFSALALGLVGRGAAAPSSIRATLRNRFDGTGPAAPRAAFAIALGLARDPMAESGLVNVMLDRSANHRLRASCALSLGMIGAEGAAAALRTTMREVCDRDVRLHCAMAAALLGDATVADLLLEVLRDPDASNYEVGTAAVALGLLGIERAVGPLLEIAVDEKDRFADLTRGLAVVGLGMLGDRSDVPALTRLRTDLNYRAHVPAITELLSIL